MAVMHERLTSGALALGAAASGSASLRPRWGEADNGRVLSVRTARSEDATAVAGVHVRAWQVAYRGLLPDAYLDGLRAEDRASRYTFARTDRDQPQTIVAVQDGTVVGFATTGPARDRDVPGAGELYALYVDPATWGVGVGRVLIAEARARLWRGGFREAVLWVMAGNQRAQRFYRADGWRPDGQQHQQEIWGLSVDATRFRRSLGRAGSSGAPARD
jgi:ribosomal protein S18 acetylase RimI-like enzyme